jgi:hypothetical protein
MALFSAIMGARAADNAADAQVESSRDAIAEQRRQFDSNRADLAPWRGVGTNALMLLGGLSGISPNGFLPRETGGATITAARPAPAPAPAAPAVPQIALNDIGGLAQYLHSDPAFANFARQMGVDPRDRFWSSGTTESGDGFDPANPQKLRNAYVLWQQQARAAPAPAVAPAASNAAAAGASTAGGPVSVQQANAILGINPDAIEAEFADIAAGRGFETSPGYSFRLGEGLKATQASAAARGLLHSGGTLKALNDYAAGSASDEFGNWFARQFGATNAKYGREQDSVNRLFSLAGFGQNATNAGVQAGSASANAISNLFMAQGDARANAAIGGFNAMQQGIGNTLAIGNILRPRPSLNQSTF